MKNDDDEIKSPSLQDQPSSLMKKVQRHVRRSSTAEALRTSSPVENRTSDEDGNHQKSASETNLTELFLKSDENLTEESTIKSVINAEHTQSLDNSKSMPPFGELIVDEQEATVKYFSRDV